MDVGSRFSGDRRFLADFDVSAETSNATLQSFWPAVVDPSTAELRGHSYEEFVYTVSIVATPARC
jgi:hypothetical protein